MDLLRLKNRFSFVRFAVLLAAVTGLGALS